MSDEIKEIPGCDVVEAFGRPCEVGVHFFHGKMHLYYALAERLVLWVDKLYLPVVISPLHYVHLIQETFWQDVKCLGKLFGDL